MNINIKCVQNMYKIFLFGFFSMVVSTCSSVDPETDRILTNEYAALYEAIYQRDGDRVLEFVEHPDSLIRRQAWRALIQTPIDDLDQQIQSVLVANNDDAWASLWFKKLNEKHIAYFHSLWDENPHLRRGLLVLFSEVGNRSTFERLLTENETGDLNFDYKLAYAIGARSRTIELTNEEEIKLIDRALSTKNGKNTQAYFYGYYRGRKQFSLESENHAVQKWTEYYPVSDEGNQSLSRILSKNHLDVVLRHYPIESYERMNVQLAIEIAQAINRNESTDYSKVILNALLDHRNSNVQISTLQAIKRHPEVAESLFGDIMNKIALIDYREPLARMEAFNTIINPSKYVDEMKVVAGEDPSLQTLKYEILEKIYSKEELFDTILEDYASDNRLIRFYAIQKLGSLWLQLDEEFRAEASNTVRNIIAEFAARSDRSMFYISASFLMDSLIFANDDYQTVENLLANFELPEDVEVFQSISQVLFDRFFEDAQPLIDSLAMQGNMALNRTLIQQGWDILQGDYYPMEFRKPDWESVSKRTRNPFVVIETKKGDIILKLNMEIAPVTINGMDELISNGEYQNTPFHRVIPNFVIQGGDVESQDGFGGPGFVVPTEASSTMYNRGVVGIASAGTDTEGSQFFIMHQWKPHLNGRYTVVGEVVEGMDVVDRIIQGDVIERMYWY